MTWLDTLTAEARAPRCLPMPGPRIEDLERAAARHWRAPEQEPLGEWLLRAADGFTGRANSALPLGDPGLPLPEAVTAVEGWYRRRNLPPMIVLPRAQGAGPDPLDNHVTERGWVPRPGPAVVMTAAVADIPASDTGNAPARALYARCGFRDSHRYHYMIAP